MTKGNRHCCVPLCSNDTRYCKEDISFHIFPAGEELKKQWIVKIRRDVGPTFQITRNTLVCSAHFQKTEKRKTLAGKRMLLKDAVPSVFHWTKTPSKRVGPKERPTVSQDIDKEETEAREGKNCALENKYEVPVATFDHDYHVLQALTSAQLGAAQMEVERLQQENQALKVASFGLERFSSNASLINFYTGFKDYSTLLCVFDSN